MNMLTSACCRTRPRCTFSSSDGHWNADGALPRPRWRVGAVTRCSARNGTACGVWGAGERGMCGVWAGYGPLCVPFFVNPLINTFILWWTRSTACSLPVAVIGSLFVISPHPVLLIGNVTVLIDGTSSCLPSAQQRLGMIIREQGGASWIANAARDTSLIAAGRVIAAIHLLHDRDPPLIPR